jgi:ABC-type Fe3+ transport system substrate-binding protein
VSSGKNPLSRHLYYDDVNPASKRAVLLQFIDWVLSPDGQDVVSEVGYIPAVGFAAAAEPRQPNHGAGQALVTLRFDRGACWRASG